MKAKKINISNTINEEPANIWNPVFISIFLANAMMYLGQQMVQTLVSKYAYSLGATTTIVGLVASGFAYTALLLKLVSAPAIDVFNKKYLLAGALAVMGISFVGYSVTTQIPLIFAFRLLQGAGQAFTATCCLAMATDALPHNQLGKGIGYFSLAQAMCQAVGPTVGLKLVSAFGYSVTFIVASICMFFAVFMALRVKTPAYVKTKKFKISIRNMFAKEAILPAVLMFFLSMAFCNINSFLVIYGEAERGLPSTQLGYFFTVYALTLLITRPLIGGLADRFGYVRVLIPAMLMFACSFWLISVATSIGVLLLAAFINAFGYGVCQPAVQSLCMKRVPIEKRGAGSCTSYVGNDLGNLVGPVIAGAVAGTMGYSGMWRIMTISIFIAILIMVGFRKNLDRVKAVK